MVQQLDSKAHTRHSGYCHCGAVSFDFTAPPIIDMTDCDCSICSMTAYQHIFVPQSDVILRGTENLTTYTFNTGAAKHLFCSVCGIKPLYIPRSHPECYSINLRCIKPGTLSVGKVIAFSGSHWEANIDALRGGT